MEMEELLTCGSTGAKIGEPIRKCPGVSAHKSDGTVDIGEIGLEFKQASIFVNNVDNSSIVYL